MTSKASNLNRDGVELLEQLRDYLHTARKVEPKTPGLEPASRFKYEPPEKYNPFDEQPEALPRGDRV